MKKLILLLLVIIIGIPAFSQDEDEEKTGPNNTHFIHPYLSLGFMTPPEEGDNAKILFGKSHIITYGIRYKLKIADFFAVGTSLNYTYQVWHMKQEDGKMIPTSVLYDKEKILSHNLGSDFYLRFNIGKRSNTVGNFIDLGVYGEWAFSTKRRIENNDDLDNEPYGHYFYSTDFHKLNYMEKINYGLETRLAYGRYVLFGKYRMSDLFTQDFKDLLLSDTELPRLVIGLEIGFHK